MANAAKTDWAALDASPPLDEDLIEAIEWTVGKRAENIISQREQTMRAIKKYAVELARDGERERWFAFLFAVALWQLLAHQAGRNARCHDRTRVQRSEWTFDARASQELWILRPGCGQPVQRWCSIAGATGQVRS